ncbi:hypothetical protein ABW18_10525 [Gordonia jacobaea]|uniref:DUF222 domain-containing protein n=2 Tax=Gordoniaceae TaxID=85026 RepID=A0ABR5IDE6_9ACTN|nr:hypothetical protein ABW18_10525 [Gordonia jacobaea]
MTNTCTDHPSLEASPAPSRIRIMAAPDYEMCGPMTRATRDESPAAIPARSGADMQRQESPPRRATRAAAIAAREFSVGTLTMIFEVISRRRPASHLQHRVGMQVDDQIDALARARAAGDDMCIPTVRRVHVQMCDAGTAEIFGTYSRQGRSRAFAGRIERVPCRVRVAGQPRGRYSPVATRVEYRWQLVVLTLG